MLTGNKLKIIASVVMFLDHFVTVFFAHNEMISLVFRLLGRLAAPIFCYFIAEGFFYTSNLKKYTIRLLILAVISHIPYDLAFGLSVFRNTSVVWPLAMGLIALTAYRNEKLHLLLKMAIIGACCILSYTANWNFVAVLWILGFGIFHGNFKHQMLSFIVVGVLFHLAPVFYRFGFFHDRFPQWFQLGIFFAIPLLAMYNGKNGKKSGFMTWFFYVFYPAHLILLYVLKHFTHLAEILNR
ncbi:MAG: conjugal transfer protein TraX [Treponema sp.]|nr:conjugal transfer protein TraX [Treponema sp.]